MMDDTKLAGPCGVYCGGCEYLEVRCSGCGGVEGKPFWTVEMETPVCLLYNCCVVEKKIEHCGLCDELPCQMFLSFHDPALNPEEAEKSVREREQTLRRRREIGTGEWLAEAKG
jgi:hypothetical protein